MRELLEESGTPRTPGVMTSVVVVLAALAALRGDEEAAGVLLEFSGRALLEEGIRTPVDLVLHAHYTRRWGRTSDALSRARTRELAAAMKMSSAIDYGLRTHAR